MKTRNRSVVLAVLGAIAAAVLTAPTVAVAEETVLCQQDSGESPCPYEKAATHLHFLAKELTLLPKFSSAVKCEALFLADTTEKPSGAPLRLNAAFYFFNCTGSCEIVEENGPSELKLLRTESELLEFTFESSEAKYRTIKCGACSFTGEGLVGHGLGGLETGSEKLHITFTKAKVGPCPTGAELDALFESLEELYIPEGLEPPTPHKTALCTTDEATATCIEEHKVNSVDFEGGLSFLNNILTTGCEGLISGSVGAAGKPQEVKIESKFSGCSYGCAITEVSSGSELSILMEGGEFSEFSELASAAIKGLELFVKCGSTIECTFGPAELTGELIGQLASIGNGHLTFTEIPLGKGEGAMCPSEASLDAFFVASSPTYIREDYVKPLTALCSKDEGTPICKSENQLKSIDYKDKAVEILTNLINVKCEGLASGTVGSPGNPLEIKAELTYTGCSGGCFVTDVSGPGKIMLERSKAEEAAATSEGFEIFVKCGTTIKCLLGPEKMVGKVLGALTTGDNGHLTFSKVSMGKGEGATCPSEATLDALFVASSAAYIG